LGTYLESKRGSDGGQNVPMAAWFSEYLIRNGARMDDYYVNYGEFEIDFTKHYYENSNNSNVELDNGIWTYKGGVSFPLAFYLHQGGGYQAPANIRDYGISILDGEEFRLTHTNDGKRSGTTVNQWAPSNIWCFKRK